MQQRCPACGSAANGQSRFCTNCGTVLPAVQPYRQSWEAAPAQEALPPWAQTQGNVYQQQQAGYQQPMGGNSASDGGLGFGGQGDTTAKKLIAIVAAVALGALLLLILCIALAIVVPIPGVRTFFLIIAILLIIIPWIIISRIRRLIRRTLGEARWFF